MKKISLFKITVIVITATIASNFVNAEDMITELLEQSQSTMALKEQTSFASLIETLDTDQDGMLSPIEVSASQNKLLQEEFTNLDLNQDQQIDEAEFNSYLAEVKDKAIDVEKSDDE